MSTNPYECFEASADPPPALPAQAQRRVVLSGTLSVADVLHAQRLAGHAFRRHIILGIAVVMALLLLLLDRTGGGESLPWTRSMLILICLATPLALAINWARRYFSFSRQARQHVGVFAPSETIVTPDGFSTVTEHAESRIKWTLFRGFRASDRVVVLYLQFPAQFLIIARAKLEDPSQWPLVLELVSDALPRL